MFSSLPTIDRDALRAQVTVPNGGLLGLAVILSVAANYYGSIMIAVEAVALGAILGATVVNGYRETLRQWSYANDRAETTTRLAKQAEEARVALASIPSADEYLREATQNILRRRDLIALGLACPDDCDACAEDARIADDERREFLADRARRHGHADVFGEA